MFRYLFRKKLPAKTVDINPAIKEFLKHSNVVNEIWVEVLLTELVAKALTMQIWKAFHDNLDGDDYVEYYWTAYVDEAKTAIQKYLR